MLQLAGSGLHGFAKTGCACVCCTAGLWHRDDGVFRASGERGGVVRCTAAQTTALVSLHRDFRPPN